MSNEVIKIKRLFKPGEKDRNGRIYDIRSYREELDSERVKSLLTNRQLHVEAGGPVGNDLNKLMCVNLENSVGVITKINDDYVDLIPKNNKIASFIKKAVEDDKIRVGMRYVGKEQKLDDGTIFITDIKLISFDLVGKDKED